MSGRIVMKYLRLFLYRRNDAIRMILNEPVSAGQPETLNTPEPVAPGTRVEDIKLCDGEYIDFNMIAK